MARYPAKTSSFATKPYGATEEAWEEAKAKARAVLYEWAAANRYVYYTELADRVTGITWLDGRVFGARSAGCRVSSHSKNSRATRIGRS